MRHFPPLRQRYWLLAAAACAALLVLWPHIAAADPYPPTWNGGEGASVHYPPVQWPSEPANLSACAGEGTCGGWKPYTRFGYAIADPRIQDPSNGGTSPQNYVNVSSGCVDRSLPSIYASYNAVSNTLLFRWRVEQIANTYATGPSAGNYGSTDPWSSALWTVFFDLNGDGYRDLAAHLDGSSGGPSTAIDRIVGIWGNLPTNQSLDYINNPAIHLLGHNPTAFVDQATNRILNFQNRLSPVATWPNGSSETRWDYGTTRSEVVTRTGANGATCDEYFVDYQIPLSMLDATSLGGPKITGDTPIAMLFCTANSLNNPLQKDCVYPSPWTGDPNQPAPFGDLFTPNGGTIVQPIVDSISVSGCGPATLTANVQEALKFVDGQTQTTLAGVSFYYYDDANGDGQPNDGSTWTLAGAGTRMSLNRWSATWDSSTLSRGQYLIGVQATDDVTLNADGKSHRTFSYLSASQAAALTPASGELDYANPSAAPGVVYATAVNTCGAPPPYLTKSASVSQVAAGDQLQFTITIHNTGQSALSVSNVSDVLPPGFSYVSTNSQTLGTLSGSPSAGASGTLQWTFSSASVPAGSTGTLVLTAAASTVAGVYNNVAAAETGAGSLSGDPVQVVVGSPRLSIAKTASRSSANPGDQVVYHLTYSNESLVGVSNAVVQDVLPAGIDYGSASGSPTFDTGARTLTWNLGSLAAGADPVTLVVTGTVANPFSSSTANPLVNTATIRSDQTSPVSASATTYVNSPRPILRIQKSADKTQVAAGGNVVFTLSYANVGDASATSVVIDDPIPSGFSFVSATGGGTNNSGTVRWAIGTLAAGASSSVQVTLQAASSYTAANPQTNTATISSAESASASDSFKVGVTQSGQACSTYYFHNATTSVGSDGTQKTANTTAPTGAGIGVSVTTQLNQVYTEVARFYQDPATATDVSFGSGSIDTSFWVDRVNGNSISIRATVYDYNSDTGTKTQLGQATPSFGGSTRGAYAFSVPASGTLRRGHRLLWVFEVKSDVNNKTDTILFQFDGTVANSLSGSGSNVATSNGSFCVKPPVGPVLDKQVNLQQVQPGGSLRYSINIGNTGGMTATTSLITDTLPAGVTFGSATLDGTTITPASSSGQQYVFSIKSSGQSAGMVAPGASALLVITSTVNRPLAAGITSLTNNVTSSNDQTYPLTDAATTAVLRPQLSVSKMASRTSLLPGDTVAYTVTVLNSGSGTATSVTVQDALPATTYFTYAPGSARLNGSPVSGPTGGTLSVNAGTLASGASAIVTFQMKVAASGVPSGMTTLDNTATASAAEDGTSVSSPAATVIITGNPELNLSKAADPASSWSAGSLVTYTLTVSNTGSADAANVQVLDPVPASTTYVAGTLAADDVSQTDTRDTDAGYFDAVHNRVEFSFATLPAGSTRTLRFRVRVNSPLANGLTPVTNEATVTAANAATQSASAAGEASASPLLSLSKVGPANVPYPAAHVDGAVNAASELQVDNATRLAIGQQVLIAGQTRQITAISGQTLTLDGSISAGDGADVIGGIDYSLGYRNSGNASATGVVLIDTLPAGVTFVEATDSGVYNAGAGTVTWSLGTLSAGTSGVVQLTVFPGGVGSLTNRAALSSAETSTLTSTVATMVGGLRIDKSAVTPSVQQTMAGTTASYTLLVDNTAGTAATGVTVSDLLPNGFTYIAGSATYGGNASRASTADPADGAAQPAWGTWTIPAGGSLSITFDARVTAQVGPARYSNFADASSSDLPSVSFDGLVTDADDVQVTEPVVALAKSVSPSTVDPGGSVQYTLRVANSGDAVATGVRLTDTLPSGFTYVSTDGIASSGTVTRTSTLSPAQGASHPHWGTWSIAPGGMVSVTFTVDAGSTPGTYANSASATSGNTLIPDLSDVAPVTVSALPEPAVALTKTVSSSAVYTGGSVQYTLTAANSGNAAASGVQITDTLPSGFTYVSTDGIVSDGAVTRTFTLSPTPGALHPSWGTWNIGAGSAVSITFTVEAGSTPGIYRNSASATASNTTIPDLSEVAPVTVSLPPEPVVALAKTVTPSATYTGGSVQYTLTAANSGDAAATGVQLTDTLPSGFTYVSTDGIASSGIVTRTSTVSPTQGVTQPGWGTWSIGAGSAVSITFTVDASGTPGIYANSASATAGNTTIPDVSGVATVTVSALTVSGTVFDDLNGNGTRDTGDGPIANVTVQLINPATSAVVATTQSGADGTYRFTALARGAYIVRETDPAGYGSTTANSVPILVAAGSLLVVNFGDRATGSISGVVFDDRSGDGLQNTGEAGMAGVTLSLYTSGGALATSTTSAGDGSYHFNGLAAGSYRVQVTRPTGYSGTTPAAAVVQVQENGLAVADFGLRANGTISGVVFNDLNGSGTWNALEPVLAGVTIDLLAAGGSVITTTTTDANGYYAFTAVTPGTYAVIEVDPTGYVSRTSNRVPVLMLSGGTAYASFGDAQSGVVSGSVYVDLNGDQKQNPGEQGLGAVIVRLLDVSDTAVATTTTTLSGFCSFTGLAAGGYKVQQVVPDGYNATTANPVTVTVPAGGAAIASFGDRPAGTVSGVVFNDQNGSHLQEPGEPGLGVVKIELVNSQSDIIGTAYTTAGGRYDFDGVTGGSYTVRQTVPSGFVATTTNPVAVTIPEGGSASANFADQAVGTVVGTVYDDLNDNGQQDDDEPGLGGVTVGLYTSEGASITTTTTSASGGYAFTGVTAGSYRVMETDPGGVTSTTANDEPITVPADGVGQASFGDGLAPTSAFLTRFEALVDGERVIVEWETASEIGTVGFMLYRSDGDGTYRSVAGGSVPGLMNETQGGLYRVIDPGARPGGTYTYRLEETVVGGSRAVYGPFTVTADRAGNPWQGGTGPYERIAHADPQPVPSAAPSSASSRGKYALWLPVLVTSNNSRADSVRIALHETGIYMVDIAQVAWKLGLPVAQVSDLAQSGRLLITHLGQSIPWSLTTDGRGLYFYGEAAGSIYTSDNIYYVQVGDGRRMEHVAGQPADGSGPGSFLDVSHVEENHRAPLALAHDPEADYWLWDYVVAGDASRSDKTFTLPAPGATASGAVTLTARFMGATAAHHVRVSLNDTVIGEGRWQGATAYTLSLDVDPALLHNGANTLRVSAVRDPGMDVSVFYVDYFNLGYQRAYRAADGRLLARAEEAGRMAIEGFTSSDILVFDVSDPANPQVVDGAAVDATGAAYRVSFQAAGAGRRYLALARGTALRPASIVGVAALDLRSPDSGADYLILTTSRLRQPAEELAAYRATQGLKTRVVDVQTVYDNFSYGLASPHAIQAFLAYAYRSWNPAPRYVLLAGQGSFDYRNYQGYDDTQVPTLLVASPDGLVAAENRLADVDADGLPEMALGRLSVANAAEFDAYVAKIRAYESDDATWARQVLLLADNQDPGGDFPTDSNGVADLLPAQYTAQRVYLSEHPAAEAHTLTLDVLHGGAGIVNFIGHAGLDRLAQEGLLTSADVPNVANGSRLPFVTAMTCVIGQSALPGYRALGDQLVLQGDGGAAAVWAATAQSANNVGRQLDKELLQAALSGDTQRLGDAIMEAIHAYTASGGPRSILDVYHLLGDPALEMRWK